MKIVNIMNFVRDYDPRYEGSAERMFALTESELELVQKYGFDNTFLLQYDALINPKYQTLFKTKADDTTELGLWYEIVRPLTDAVGLPWRGREDWSWDWHIVPGFSMAYTHDERKTLIDEAMNRFKDIYGYYPKTVGSWLIDSYTAEYLDSKYNVSAIAICRDQVATDAYTLVGGHFNTPYFPSKNNIFTPAQTKENTLNVPVFRLLGSDPAHCYDENKYINDPDFKGCCTLEPVWKFGSNPNTVQWYFDTYFKNESLNTAYAHLGQENSFANAKVLEPLEMQLEKIKNYPDVKIQKMCDSGEEFKAQFKGQTPASACTAINDWANGDDMQSVYYNCKNYVANIVRFKEKTFIRSLYKFDESIKEHYYDNPCKTWDALYENLPIVDTVVWPDNGGMVLDNEATAFTVFGDGENLNISWGEKTVIFSPEGITLKNIAPTAILKGAKAVITLCNKKIDFCYKGTIYSLALEGGRFSGRKEGAIYFNPDGDELTLLIK